MNEIRILPYQHLIGKTGLDLAFFKKQERIVLPKNHYFFASGKNCIHEILKFEDLELTDEVFISTTSGTKFVSSCVTCTLFNYAKVSRVLTKNTKLIFVIHEFGFANPDTEKLIFEAKKKNIKVVEDFAHNLKPFINNPIYCRQSDYAIVSLPKSLPVQSGGILFVKNENALSPSTDNLKFSKDFEEKKTIIQDLYRRRIELFEQYQSEFGDFKTIFKLKEGDVPFCYTFATQEAPKVYKTLEESGEIELLKTYNETWVSIPINPFHSNDEVAFIITRIKKILSI